MPAFASASHAFAPADDANTYTKTSRIPPAPLGAIISKPQ